MNGGGDQLLSRTGLAEDEDRRVLRSNLLRPKKHMPEAVALPENLIELMFQFHFPSKVNILDLELVFQLLDYRKGFAKGFRRLSMFFNFPGQFLIRLPEFGCPFFHPAAPVRCGLSAKPRK